MTNGRWMEVLRILELRELEVFRLDTEGKAFFRFVGKKLERNDEGGYETWRLADKKTFDQIMSGHAVIRKFPTVMTDIKETVRLYCRNELRAKQVRDFLEFLQGHEFPKGYLELSAIDYANGDSGRTQYSAWYDRFFKMPGEKEDLGVVNTAVLMEISRRKLSEWCGGEL